MPDSRFDAIFTAISGARSATPEDVRTLRALFYGDGTIGPAEARRLIDLDQTIDAPGSDWIAFFHEALTDCLVRQEAPRGYVDEAKARWLLSAIESDGLVKTASELELVVRILEEADSAPEFLARFALEQVQAAVLEGAGPLANGTQLRPGIIGPAEVSLLRRTLYASGSDAGLSVSRAEAEILFCLNDRTVEAENDPGWRDLFVKAIAGSVMAAATAPAPSRAAAAAQDAWLQDRRADPAGFLKRMARGGLSGFSNLGSDPGQKTWDAHLDAQDSAIAAAEPVDQLEAAWLAARLSADGRLHPNEEALLRFLKTEAPSIDPVLRPLLDKVA